MYKKWVTDYNIFGCGWKTEPLEWMVRALRFLDMIGDRRGDRRRMKTQEGEAGRRQEVGGGGKRKQQRERQASPANSRN